MANKSQERLCALLDGSLSSSQVEPEKVIGFKETVIDLVRFKCACKPLRPLPVICLDYIVSSLFKNLIARSFKSILHYKDIYHLEIQMLLLHCPFRLNQCWILISTFLPSILPR